MGWLTKIQFVRQAMVFLSLLPHPETVIHPPESVSYFSGEQQTGHEDGHLSESGIITQAMLNLTTMTTRQYVE